MSAECFGINRLLCYPIDLLLVTSILRSYGREMQIFFATDSSIRIHNFAKS